MPFNGSGTFQSLTPPQYPAVAGEVIRAGYYNAVVNDLIAGLTNCVTRDGQSPPTANLPLGGFKFTGAASAAASDEFTTRGQLGATSGTIGADLIGFISSAAASVARTVQSKLDTVIRAEDVGLVGDASDELTKLNNLFARAAAIGARVELDGTKTYGANGALTLPANINLTTNGAVFKDLAGTTSNTAFITVQGKSTVDYIKVDVPTGIRRDRGIRFAGTNIRVGWAELVSADQQVNTSDLSDAGVAFGSSTDVVIGKLIVSKYDRATRVELSSKVHIIDYEQSSFVRGAWIMNSSEVTFYRGKSATLSPNASVSPGHNAFLIGCDVVGATHNITLIDQIIEASGEHGVRLAGPESIYNFFLVRARIKGVGACGFKSRGSDGVTASYNHNIVIDSCIFEDCGDSASAPENRCCILIEWAQNVQIIAPICRARTTAYCASYAIMVNAAQDVQITSPSIRNPRLDGVLVYAREASVDRCVINGGMAYNPGRHGYQIWTAAGQMARGVHFEGVKTRGPGSYGGYVNNDGTIEDCSFDLDSEGHVTGLMACPSTEVMLTLKGDPIIAKSAVSGKNGSTWSDPAAGNFFVLKTPGTWTAAA